MKYEESQFIYRQITGACDEMLQGQYPEEGLEIIYNVEQIKTQAHYVY